MALVYLIWVRGLKRRLPNLKLIVPRMDEVHGIGWRVGGQEVVGTIGARKNTRNVREGMRPGGETPSP
jgi:hypothetical protein